MTNANITEQYCLDLLHKRYAEPEWALFEKVAPRTGAALVTLTPLRSTYGSCVDMPFMVLRSRPRGVIGYAN